jgi:hypothetical protein
MPTYFNISVTKQSKVQFSSFSSSNQLAFTFNNEALWLEAFSIHYATYSADQIHIFIHGLWANIPSVHSDVCKRLTGDLWSEDALVVSIIWEGYLHYPLNHAHLSRSVAPALLPHLRGLFHFFNDRATKVNVVAHSMGCILLDLLIADDTIELPANSKIVLASPDISIDQLTHIRQSTQVPILVLSSSQDLTLRLANILMRYKRIGRITESSFYADLRIQHIRVEEFKEEELLAGRLSKHRYFYTQSSIRKQIKAFFVSDKL